MATAAPVLCVPMHLQAFTLNDSVASDSDAKIAPITQPNYTFLRFNENLPASDVQDNVDLHWTSPASRNSRVTDLGTGLPRSYRKGIYLSWTLPRFYRSGSAASANNPTNPGATSGPDSKVPIFRAVPTRWLIVRHIAPSSIASAVSDPNVATKLQNTAWVVESNRVWTIQDLDNLDDANQATQKSNFVPVDLQVDVSPFISPTQNNDKSNMAKQSEIFLGCKTAIEDWKADSAHEADGKSRIKPLSLLNSSNPFFADFQHHNGNCFSMLDGFGYLDAKGNVQHLQTATASYYVLGWHADSAEDPLAITKTAAQRLQDLNLIFNGTDPGISGWFTKSTATLCHGALYQVMWDLNKLPSPLPAKVASNALNAATPNEPISVGTTPTDALIAYVAAHQDTDTGDLKKLENDIWALRQLLVAQNDSADALLEAHDQLSDYGFERSDGGGWWHFSGGSSGTNLSQSNKDDMVKLSQLQVALDNTTRALQSLQWQLFAVWWRLVTGASDGSISGRANIKQKEVTPLITRMKILQGSSAKDVNSVLWLRDQIQQMTDPKKDPPMGVEKATSDPFFLTKEPTLLLGGISAGWPSDYLDPLSCRMDGELSTTIPNVSADWASLVNTYGPNAIKKLPASISTAATSLLYEFAALSSSSTAMAGGPLYHDPGALSVDSGVTLLLRDQWSGQPWFPLFVEWEAEYYHIPYNTWTLDPTVTLGTSNTNPMLQYGIGSNINLSSGTPMEERVIQGRTLLLPQPGFSLQNSINQVLQKMTDEDLTSAGLAPAERTFLNTKLAALPYLSMPLSGLRQHLTTRIPGSHIKPNQREPGQIPTPMDASTDPNIATVSAGLDSQALNLIGTETALTPYGRGLENLATVNFDKYPLFKPVTHGQLRFKHLNVIDKFGQAICALDPTPSHLRQHVAPALADNYKVQALADGTPNVVIKDVLTDNTGKVLPKANEFIQLGPRINQPARINAEPVVQDSPSADAKGKPRWRPAYGWENPIYGWVVNNYLDNSIQIFEQDGTFYREITLGGFSGDLVSPAWLPFEKPAAAQVPSQLDQLVAKLADKTYLQAFMNMLNASTNDLPPAPATYAQFMNAIISKPLALVNLGWSLELSSPPMHNESTLNLIEPTMTLLDPNTPELPCGRQSAKKPVLPSVPQTRYTFTLKIGDATRTYDGLIGYFLPPTSPPATPQVPFDLSHLYTYWPTANSPTVPVAHSSYLPLQAFYASPDKFVDTSATPDVTKGTKLKTPTELDAERNSNLYVVTAIVDPFTAVHAYSGLLPISSLKLPQWVVQEALTAMTAFLRMGPLLVTQDVPAFDSKQVLTSSDPDAVVAGSGVAIPAVGVGDWQWLQPYDDPTKTVVSPHYMGLATKKVDIMPRFENAPYTAVEGFLRLKKPLAVAGSST